MPNLFHIQTLLAWLFLGLLSPAVTLSNTVKLRFASNEYATHVGAKNFTLVCKAEYMRRIDVVWLIYSLQNANKVKAIYSDRKYIGNSAGKYLVRIAEGANETLTTSLTIFNVKAKDFTYAYKCECNIYKRCSNTNRAKANMTIREISAIRNYNQSIKMNNFSDRKFAYCNGGAVNTTQYFLIVLTALVTVGATFLLYFSNERALNEKYILIFGLILAGLSLLVSLIIWINAQFFGKNAYISVLITSFGLFTCLVIWALDIVFLKRFELVNVIKIVIYALYMFELCAAILLFSANIYCAGESFLPPSSDFDYSYLELIGACLLLLFAIFLALAYGTIFYTLQEHKINEKINLTRLFKINKNFVFPSKSDGADLRVSSLSAKNSINFETCSVEQISPSKLRRLSPLKSNFQKHGRIRSESSLLDKSLVDADYLRTLQQNYTIRPQKTNVLPSVSSELDATQLTNAERTNVSLVIDSSLNQNNNTMNVSTSRVSVRPSSRFSPGNFKETYIFFKKPLSKFTQKIHAKKATKNKSQKTSSKKANDE